MKTLGDPRDLIWSLFFILQIRRVTGEGGDSLLTHRIVELRLNAESLFHRELDEQGKECWRNHRPMCGLDSFAYAQFTKG